MSETPIDLPPDLTRVLAELGAPTLVTSSPQPATIYVSYLPPRRCFSARRDWLSEIRATRALHENCGGAARSGIRTAFEQGRPRRASPPKDRRPDACRVALTLSPRQ